jgi:hypothetical protein
MLVLVPSPFQKVLVVRLITVDVSANEPSIILAIIGKELKSRGDCSSFILVQHD